MWVFCSLCIKSIPMNMNTAHRVTFQHWCVSRIRSTKGYSRWGEKLRSDWSEIGNPRRTHGSFPYTLQPMKIAKSNTFPSAQRDPGLWLGDLWKSVCKNRVQIRGHGGGSQTLTVIATHTWNVKCSFSRSTCTGSTWEPPLHFSLNTSSLAYPTSVFVGFQSEDEIGVTLTLTMQLLHSPDDQLLNHTL